jgi:hypothetical protein
MGVDFVRCATAASHSSKHPSALGKVADIIASQYFQVARRPSPAVYSPSFLQIRIFISSSQEHVQHDQYVLNDTYDQNGRWHRGRIGVRGIFEW